MQKSKLYMEKAKVNFYKDDITNLLNVKLDLPAFCTVNVDNIDNIEQTGSKEPNAKITTFTHWYPASSFVFKMSEEKLVSPNPKDLDDIVNYVTDGFEKKWGANGKADLYALKYVQNITKELFSNLESQAYKTAKAMNEIGMIGYDSATSINDNTSKEFFSKLSNQLPDMDRMVEHPESQGTSCATEKPLRSMIMHLNDTHWWTREKIADWLDDLADQGVVDLEFKVDLE